jgi:hypothetical protein
MKLNHRNMKKKTTNDLEKIEAYFTTENEHWNEYALDIYNEARGNNLFPDIETPLWIFDNATNEFYESRNKPLQVLNELKETFTKEKLSNEQQAFILEHLVIYFRNTVYTDDKSKEEISLSKVKKLLEKELEIKKPNEVLKLEAHTTTPKAKPQLGEYSNSQLVLIFYYFFKHSGIEPRVNTDIAPIAKFLHLITGKEFSNTQSSDFYKKLSKAPNHISDKSLIDDLNRIKPLFQKVELNGIVKMIDNEIDQCRTAIKETKTGKR